MQPIFELAPIVADIISAHRPAAREEFMRACLRGSWRRAAGLVEDALKAPSSLYGYQEKRLREFLDLIRSGTQASRSQRT